MKSEHSVSNPIWQCNQFVLSSFSDLRCCILMKLCKANVFYGEQMDSQNHFHYNKRFQKEKKRNLWAHGSQAEIFTAMCERLICCQRCDRNCQILKRLIIWLKGSLGIMAANKIFYPSFFLLLYLVTRRKIWRHKIPS